ncbi:MAG: DUF2130 domain-containing protein [Cytophagales bacterium]|nr:DUF2130 domain-containing protein [Cytophagales bacterium]
MWIYFWASYGIFIYLYTQFIYLILNMEGLNIITCPKCKHQFNAEKALTDEVELRLRTEYNQRYKGEVAKKEAEMQLRLQESQKELADKQKETEKLLKDKIKQDFELELKSQKEELEQRKNEIYALKTKEIELMKKEQALTEQSRLAAIEFDKKMLEESKKLEENIRKKIEEQSVLALKEKDILIEQLKKHMDEMNKKAGQGSMQLQGEAQEMVLKDILKSAFPLDMISDVAVGVKGADLVQHVKNNMGKDCGTIVYESKRTKHFAAEWIDKLKNDLRAQKANVALLVTETMPKDMEKFGEKDGVWICTFAEVVALATVLRHSLIDIYEVRMSQDNKGEKMHMLYDFLTGTEFKSHIEAIAEGFIAMQQSLQKEKLIAQKNWAEREKMTEKVLVNMMNMYGGIKGIAGNAVPELKLLEAE